MDAFFLCSHWEAPLQLSRPHPHVVRIRRKARVIVLRPLLLSCLPGTPSPFWPSAPLRTFSSGSARRQTSSAFSRLQFVLLDNAILLVEMNHDIVDPVSTVLQLFYLDFRWSSGSMQPWLNWAADRLFLTLSTGRKAKNTCSSTFSLPSRSSGASRNLLSPPHENRCRDVWTLNLSLLQGKMESATGWMKCLIRSHCISKWSYK